MKAGDRTAAEALRQSILDVIAKRRFLSNRTRNPSEGKQRVAKRMRDFGHCRGA
jgi:hypothetical protein